MQRTKDNRKLYIIWSIPQTTESCCKNAEEWQGDEEQKKRFLNNLIYQYIDIYQQLEFHRNVSETILAYSTDIPCKYNLATVKTPSLFPTIFNPLTHTRNANKTRHYWKIYMNTNKAPIN